MTTPMRIGVVGTGSVGRRHLSNLVALGTEPVAISEHHGHESVEVAGVTLPAYGRLDEALEHLDAVVIANPSSLHLATATTAIAAGCHVLIEKPAHIEAAGLAELQSAADARGVIVGVVQQFRFHPIVERMRDIVGSNELGLILTVEGIQGEHLADYHPDEDYRSGYAARRELGGGVLLTQIHLLDLLVWILGRPEAVLAVGGTRSTLELDVEDTASFLLSYPTGIAAYGHVDYLRRPKQFTIAISGEQGSVEFDYHAGSMRFVPAIAGGSATVEQVEIDRNDLFVGVLQDFLGAIAGSHELRCPLTSAIDVLTVVDAIRLSMNCGENVRIRDGQ